MAEIPKKGGRLPWSISKPVGDMAVANAVGSNTFDILLGLGGPWFIKVAIDGPICVLASGLA